FFFLYYAHHLFLLSFPTRRSSDLLCISRVWSLEFGVWSLELFPLHSQQHSRNLFDLDGFAQAKGKAFGDGRRINIGAKHAVPKTDRKSTRLNSSHVKISYAVFCLK